MARRASARPGVGIHQTALYDMICATVLFLILCDERAGRREGVLTPTFGAWYGLVRVVEDFLRVDKQFFGLTGSQWTGSHGVDPLHR